MSHIRGSARTNLRRRGAVAAYFGPSGLRVCTMHPFSRRTRVACGRPSVRVQRTRHCVTVVVGAPRTCTRAMQARSGHQPASQTPQQWRLKPQTPAEAEKQRQQTAATVDTRREQKRSERWERIKDRLRFWD